jgi:hypothetical protein
MFMDGYTFETIVDLIMHISYFVTQFLSFKWTPVNEIL